jgi:hypothetical protein
MKYVLAVLGVIFLVILAVILITRGGPRGPEAPSLVVSKEAREGVSAVYTQEGTITGEDRRRAIRIIVNQDERRLEVLTGYGEAVEFAQTYPNTHEAFETFLVALDQAGFDDKREAPAGVDERGACPLGRRYAYELNEYSQPLLSLWGTSCGGKLGTFAGNKTTILKLFELQIPNYRDQVKDVDLQGTKVPKEETES